MAREEQGCFEKGDRDIKSSSVWWPLEVRKGKEIDSPRASIKNATLLTPWFQLGETCIGFLTHRIVADNKSVMVQPINYAYFMAGIGAKYNVHLRIHDYNLYKFEDYYIYVLLDI